MSFALPGCRSNFSLLWGTAFPKQLAEAAEKRGIHHLGLADFDNLYGAVDFYHACRDRGINPLIGVRLTTECGHLHLIARNYSGYQNLCRLVTRRQLAGRVAQSDLENHNDGIICLIPSDRNVEALRAIFSDSLYLSLDGHEGWQVIEIAKQYAIRAVANPTVSSINPPDFRLHLLLRAIDTGSLLSNLNGTARDKPDAYFPTTDEMRRRFRSFPRALDNAIRLAESCELAFPAHKNLLPDYPGCDGDKGELLRAKAVASLGGKKPGADGRYLSRLEFELNVIARMGYTDYFLIVAGIVEHCRAIGIPVVGRGSAAGSLVSYSLDITQVDPIREGLYFERFLNEARSDPPDIDLDIDWRRRDDVLAYIYDRFGHERTAMIATYTRFGARMAVREVAKAAGLPPDEVNQLAKTLPHVAPHEIADAIKRLPAVTRSQIDLRQYAPILENAARLDNFPRHLGIHPGGVVITPHPLTDYVALERATKGLVVTQCDMYQAEKLGLVKIDILGQRGQAVIVDCRSHAAQVERGRSPAEVPSGDVLSSAKDFDPRRGGDCHLTAKPRNTEFNVPDNDPATYDLLRSGKTIGVFQIESPGLRALLRDLKPQELNDITLALALIRPGASDSGMKKVFLDRFHGKEKTVYPDPRLEDILRETFGVFIYQEQVLLCARAVAGFNLPAADRLRRAITKERHDRDYDALYRRFVQGALKNGVPEDRATEIFKLLSYFAGFGFCKAHAATYGYLAYQSAYFKTHYPAQFMAGVLNNGGGYYPSAIYISEARRLGCDILLPDVNLSAALFTVEGHSLRVGLGFIKGMAQETMDQILQGQPFASFDDFLSRVRLSAVELKSLIKIGAFDIIEPGRPHLLWRLRLALHKRAPVGVAAGVDDATDGDIFSGHLMVPEGKHLPPLPDFTPFERFCVEREYLEFSASVHPLTLFPSFIQVPIGEILAHDKRPCTVMGWLADIKRIKTREKKEPMVFLTLEDIDETFEVVLFPEVYEEYADLIRRYRFVKVDGTVNAVEGNMAVIADTLSPAPTGLAERVYI